MVINSVKKLGFVIPWFGVNIPGGAEAALRDVTKHMHDSGVELEILTTCVREFTADWGQNYHKPGKTVENGILVRRFPVNTKLDLGAFAAVNIKLMNGIMPLTPEEENTFVSEMVNSPALYEYIRTHKEEYSYFVFIPYMFGPTYYGIQECYEQAVMMPCFHDESYIYMEIFKKAFPKVRGMIFHALPEAQLAKRVYGLSGVECEVLGTGVDTDLTFDAERFRKKYNINEPFILYAGRKDAGKNIYSLIYQFEEYKKRNQNDLKLVLIGGGEVSLPESIKGDVYDLGFVDMQDKFDAYGAALTLCQPSKNESFSLVIMESWLCERPVIVHEECKVTKHFAESSNGGLYFSNYFEFEKEVNFYLNNPEVASKMGKLGKEFVLENFAWDVIVRKYTEYFERLNRLDQKEM